MHITIPGPTVSKSNSYRIAGSRLFKTKECKQWEKHAIRCIESALLDNWTPIKAPVELDIKVYFADRRRRDLDGVLKALLDCMNLLVYIDDAQVMKITVEKFIDASNPRIELIVS